MERSGDMNIAKDNLAINLLEARNLSPPPTIESTPAPPPCQVERQEKEIANNKEEKKEHSRAPLHQSSTPTVEPVKWHAKQTTKLQAKHGRRKKRRLQGAELRLQRNLALLREYESKMASNGPANVASDEPQQPTTEIIQEVKEGVLDDWYDTLIVDSGTTSTILTAKHAAQTEATGEASNKTFKVANGHEEEATEKRRLLHPLRQLAREADVVPGIQSSLLSTSKLADDNYITILDKEKVEIFDANNTKVITTRGAVLRGFRCPVTKLHRIPLKPVNEITNLNTETILCDRPPTELLMDRPPAIEAIHNVYELRTQAEMIRFYHAAAGFPTQATWLRAIERGYYASWPGLTVKAARKHFPESEETQKGHMKAQKSGIRSTKRKKVSAVSEPEDDPYDITTKSKEHDVMIKMVDTHDELEWKIFTDQTGSFPKKSIRGYRYIMVLVEIDSDAVLVEPMRNRTAGEMTKTYQKLIDRLNKCGIYPKMHILDNESSSELEEAIGNNNMTFQYVPPHNHRRNRAERAIQTFKAHFISILCGVAEEFPIALWCHLLPQVEMTLNMLRPSRTTPNVSSYAHLHGQHDYNAQPIAPLGMQCEMHVMPDARETFAPHSVSGYNVGTSFKHYRCYEIYVKQTRSTRIGNTVFFKHKYLTMPTITNADALLTAAQDMTTALKGGVAQTSETAAAIKALLAIYKENADMEKEKENAANSQRVRMDDARAQRVLQEIEHATATRQHNQQSQAPPLEVEYPDEESEDDEDDEILAEVTAGGKVHTEDAPANNTRSRAAVPRTITQEAIFATLEVSGASANISARSAASRKYPLQFLCDFAGAVLDGASGEMLEFRQLIKNPKYRLVWGDSYGNEIGRLAQGRDKSGIKGTDTLTFIRYGEIPVDRRKDVTYDRIVCTVRPEKESPNRSRVTFGGNKVSTLIDCGTPTADILTVKLLFNSVVGPMGA